METEAAGPNAPGPGIAPTWTSGAKDAVGTSLRSSRVWFTIGRGIINEVYYPHIDTPQVRDLGFIVADGKGFWCEVKRGDAYSITAAAPGIPAYRIVHEHERFSLTVRVCADPHRDALLLETALTPHADDDPLSLCVLLAPHLGESGDDNHASLARHGRWLALGAERADLALALLAVDDEGRDAWRAASCGCVGVSDGWQDLRQHGRLTWSHPAAGPGNVALIGEAPARARICLAFEHSVAGAVTLAAAALAAPFEQTWREEIDDWQDWHAAIRRHHPFPDRLPDHLRAVAATSAMVLKVHQDKDFFGATVASLATPWGQTRNRGGGYHLVWPRDLVQAAGGMLALGDRADARSLLRYLIATQQPDGHWFQNQWLAGTPYWRGIQLDEVAFPILLAAALAEREALGGIAVAEMVRRAASFIAREGPVTGQGRWESERGLSVHTLAVCVAALVCAAAFLPEPARGYALELADSWNAQIEDWTYVTATPVARRLGVPGHYVRTAPPATLEDPGFDVERWARAEDDASRLVGLGFLELVRLGLRAPGDPRIRNSIAVADALLKAETPSGPVWRRYPGDQYGEHRDGAPYDGTGIGRAWPILTGERGHYELAAGDDPLPYLETMARTSSRGGMIPEQVWDAAPIPERRLEPGKPTGSATPLVWAHAEFLKLCASVAGRHPFDRPRAVWERYHGDHPAPTWASWRFERRRETIAPDETLRVEVRAPATIRFSTDGWRTVHELPTRDTGLGMHVADLPTKRLSPNERIAFTFHWSESGTWEGRNFDVTVREASRRTG